MEKKTRQHNFHMTDAEDKEVELRVKLGGHKSMRDYFFYLMQKESEFLAKVPCDECRLALSLAPVVHILESVPKALKPLLRKANGKKKKP